MEHYNGDKDLKKPQQGQSVPLLLQVHTLEFIRVIATRTPPGIRFKKYIARFRNLIVANITDAKRQKALLLHYAGEQRYLRDTISQRTRRRRKLLLLLLQCKTFGCRTSIKRT